MPMTELRVHPAISRRILIIYPGLNATPDGESSQFTQAHPYRYRRIAERLQSAGAAAVLRQANPASGYLGDGKAGVDRLAKTISYALTHANSLCGHGEPELCLMGFSAGAGAVAALASEYRPKCMLLVAPSGDAGGWRIVLGLKKFTGALVILGATRRDRWSTGRPFVR
jgi:alpha-beta hydrolase superfamily lysophospholipase